jgi:hypothetical protein
VRETHFELPDTLNSLSGLRSSEGFPTPRWSSVGSEPRVSELATDDCSERDRSERADVGGPEPIVPQDKKAVRRDGERRVRRLVFRRLLDADLVTGVADFLPKNDALLVFPYRSRFAARPLSMRASPEASTVSPEGPTSGGTWRCRPSHRSNGGALASRSRTPFTSPILAGACRRGSAGVALPNR